MNEAYQAVIAASDDERRDLFVGAAARLGTPAQNVEKDFWVCWTLDALFNGLEPGGPRLLFKGGTSLSKGFGLISRFSEDIDITVFREDLGQEVEIEELEELSGKKRRAKLDEIRDACQAYINGPFAKQLAQQASSRIGNGRFGLEKDPDDKDGQSLLLWYPAVTSRRGDYIRSAVKIEAGARSALDPHISASMKPYVDDDLPDQDLTVANVVTIKPERTFWDKITILHGLYQWHERRGELRHSGQRVSRHYYDIHRLMQAQDANAWLADKALAEDCARHARMFFGSPDQGLETATSGSFTLTPAPGMMDALQRDYDAMSAMIFGSVPTLEEVLVSVKTAEDAINA
jgi:hypothetical protein